MVDHVKKGPGNGQRGENANGHGDDAHMLDA
jgi:hypothetical protein